VVDRTVSGRFKNMKGMDENTAHYVFFDPANIRGKFAAFDPSQSGSSKLLAGFNSGAPEAVGAGAGGAAGYFGAQDTNGDGVVDDAERSAQALGGLASGLVASKIIRGGVNAARGGAKPSGAS